MFEVAITVVHVEGGGVGQLALMGRSEGLAGGCQEGQHSGTEECHGYSWLSV